MERIINREFTVEGNGIALKHTSYVVRDGILYEVVKTQIPQSGEESIVETIIKDPVLVATETQAEIDFRNIPNWATWDTAQAVDYIQTNVTDLASAKTVLIAIAKSIIALRGKAFPSIHTEALGSQDVLSGTPIVEKANLS